jgi:hypothetical protein
MKTFVSTLWVFLCFSLFSQSFAQDVIARLDLGRRDPHPDFIEYSPADGGLVTLGPASTRSSRYVAINKYDAELKPQWSKEVLEQNGRKNLDFLAVIGQNILVFVSEFFPREGVIKTYYYQYNLAGELVNDEAILSVYPNQKEQKVDLQYVLSANKRKLLCYKNLENRRESETLLYYVFDEAGEYTRNGEINLKYPDNRFNVRSVQISNAGHVYLLGKFYINTRVRDPEDFKYLMYRYDTESLENTEIPIELGDRYITDLAFKLGREEDIYVAGFYSNRSTDKITGTILQKIEADGEVSINASQAFDQEFMANYLSTGQINRGRELRNFYLNNIILRSDGGVLLMAEKFYITYQSYRDIYGYWVDREIYHYEDVILTSVANDGSIEWHAIVDKNQMSENPTSLSYFKAISPLGTYVFYEYKPRRLEYNIYYNIIGIDGSVSQRTPLLKDYRSSYEFYPRFCEQINSRESLMVYYQNRGKILTIVKINVGA